MSNTFFKPWSIRLAVIAVSLFACVSVSAYIPGYDTIDVTGTYAGTYDIESVYLPGVVAHENGFAHEEALKAQAVAARTYAYYKKLVTSPGSIANGTSDQVFRKSGYQTRVQQKHYDAVAATAGEVLTFNGNIIAGFYVAGGKPTALPLTPTDTTTPAFSSDPTNTEKWVTYTYPNDDIGNSNLGTPLGFQGSPRNRGAMSQNGSNYLATSRDMNYIDILKYYYGADIQVETTINWPWLSRHNGRTLVDFEQSEQYFASTPQFSGSNRNIGSGTTAELSNEAAHTGSTSQKIVIDYDETKPDAFDGFRLRHVAGTKNIVPGTQASSNANVILEGVGSIGFWLKTNDAGMTVSIALDDDPNGGTGSLSTGDRGIFIDVIADGGWHKYEWFLEDDSYWESWVGSGDGSISTQFAIDSIQLHGSSDAIVYFDDLFIDPNAVAPVPEPTSVLVLAGLLGLSVRRRK
ncbi:SpoIID/LytB domain-containing protein [Poriferisphaera sp. WC338]|uniref:SpoIID/LytB domain-containing protein n=1 Tax=Poriferisphaera sp. WC338 TaxID=3425129 RepID=UPI003D812B46